MKKLFTVLRDAEGEDGGDNTPAPDQGKKTSKDIVTGDDKRIKKLEEHISALQDERKADRTVIDELKGMVEAAKKAPSVRIPGKSLLDELEEFMGFSGTTTNNESNQNTEVKA